MSIKYIFLFGMPRSGTTWLGKSFDSHPDTLYRHEPDSIVLFDRVPLITPRVGKIEEKFKADIEEFVYNLPENRSLRVTGKLPIFPKNYYSALAFNLRKLFLLAAKIGSRFVNDLSIPNMINFSRSSEIHLVWKSIESLGRLGIIARSVQGSVGIHIIRHPCGYIDSVLRGDLKGLFGSDVASSEDYGIMELLLSTRLAQERGLDLEYLRKLKPVERLAWRWLLFNEQALDDIKDLQNCTSIRYEDLCMNPIEEYKKLFEFAGLSWNPQSEQFITSSVHTDKSAYYSVFKDPMKSANAWKTHLQSADIDSILAVVEGTKSGELYLSDDTRIA